MNAVVGFVRTFGRFWYDFIVGDDPKIAVGVVSVLALGAVLVGAAGLRGPGLVVALTLLFLASFTVALLVDVGRSRRGRT